MLYFYSGGSPSQYKIVQLSRGVESWVSHLFSACLAMQYLNRTVVFLAIFHNMSFCDRVMGLRKWSRPIPLSRRLSLQMLWSISRWIFDPVNSQSRHCVAESINSVSINHAHCQLFTSTLLRTLSIQGHVKLPTKEEVSVARIANSGST